MTVDTSHGIITGVDCYPANQRESDIIRLKGQPCEYQEIGLDGGYDAVQKKYKKCPMFATCATGLGTVRINASAYYPAFYRNNQKVRTSSNLRIIRLRKIWVERTFAVLKQEHKLNKYRKKASRKQRKNDSYQQLH